MILLKVSQGPRYIRSIHIVQCELYLNFLCFYLTVSDLEGGPRSRL